MEMVQEIRNKNRVKIVFGKFHFQVVPNDLLISLLMYRLMNSSFRSIAHFLLKGSNDKFAETCSGVQYPVGFT